MKMVNTSIGAVFQPFLGCEARQMAIYVTICWHGGKGCLPLPQASCISGVRRFSVRGVLPRWCLGMRMMFMRLTQQRSCNHARTGHQNADELRRNLFAQRRCQKHDPRHDTMPSTMEAIAPFRVARFQ